MGTVISPGRIPRLDPPREVEPPTRGSGPVNCCGGHRERCVFGRIHSWSTWFEDGVLQRTRDTYHCHFCEGVCTAEEDSLASLDSTALPPEGEVTALAKAIETHFGPHDERCARNILDKIRPMIVAAEQARIARIFEWTGATIWVDADWVEFTDLIAANPPKPGTEPPKPEKLCDGFRWVGQPMSQCARCRRPYWEHSHEERVAAGASGIGPDVLVLVPITPAQAESCRLNWGANNG